MVDGLNTFEMICPAEIEDELVLDILLDETDYNELSGWGRNAGSDE